MMDSVELASICPGDVESPYPLAQKMSAPGAGIGSHLTRSAGGG